MKTKTQFTNRILSLLLAFMMVIGMLPMSSLTAFAANDVITLTGPLTINSGNRASYNGKTITGNVSLNYNNGDTVTKVLVIDGVTMDLTIKDLTIKTSIYNTSNPAPVALINGATLNMTVEGTNTLTALNSNAAGISVPQGCTLNITAGSTGTLKAYGAGAYGSAAGIGACGTGVTHISDSIALGQITTCGTINIAGGTIYAEGGTFLDGSLLLGSAGIGSSWSGDKEGDFSTTGIINITGGNVTAKSGYSAAAIGGGACSYVEKITISGGTVIANAWDGWGAAIGSGIGFTDTATGKKPIVSGTIIINGGDITAQSLHGASIGCGADCSGGSITINGGTVNAYKYGDSPQGAAIGGGSKSPGGTITINGGTVNAESNFYGAAIGGGSKGSGGTIKITGGTITAKNTCRRQSGAGIGGGVQGNGGTVEITGGNVYASSTNAAAIGGGWDGSDGTLTNGSGKAVSLNTFTLSGAAGGAAVTAFDSNVNYGLKDVKTLDTNKLYFYLPVNTTASSITAGGTEFFCTKDNKTYYASHDWDWSKADGVCTRCTETCKHEEFVDATCLLGKQCSICGSYISKPNEHNYVDGICTVCGIGEEDGIFYIGTAEQLKLFADYVNVGNTKADAVLMADIDMTDYAATYGNVMIGTSTNKYSGTFDGNGKKLTVNLTGASGQQYVAPFSYVNGATIKNLYTDGTITVSGKFAGGIVSSASGNTTIERCVSAVMIESSISGDGTHAGLVGIVEDSSSLTVNNCAFVGAINGANTTHCAGLVGYSRPNNANSVVIKNSYMAGTFTASTSNANTFARQAHTLENCYYLNTFGAVNASGAAQKDAAAFASGEVAYLLNGSTSEGDLAWGQKIGEDAYPVLGGDTVYYDAANGYNNHVHTWNYTVDGNKISASCNATGCSATNGGSVTLSAENVTYDGKSHDATTTGSFTEGAPTISYLYKATADGEYGDAGDLDNAGYYKATMKMGDAEVSVEFEIKKLAVTITAKDQSIIYGGSIATGTAQVTVGTLAEGHALVGITLSIEDTNVTESGSIAASNAVIHDGNSRNVTANYDITCGSGTLTIAAKEMTAESTGYTGTYDGDGHTITVTPSESDATVKYGTTEGTYNLNDAPKYYNAGTYTVYYQVTKANYTTVTGSAVVTIDPVAITVTVNEIDGQTYTGQPITPAVSITPEKGKLVGDDKLVAGTDYTVSFSENINVGTVTVTIKDVAGGNYAVSGSGSFKIVQAENEWTVTPSINGWTYGETASTPTYEAKFGTVVVTYKDADGKTVDNPTAAGSYTAVFTVTATDDYTGLSEEVSFIISKRAVTVTANNAEKTYGNDDPTSFGWTLTSGTLVGEDKLNIQVSRESGETAGTYPIIPSETENANPNYNITFVNGTFTIQQAAIDPSVTLDGWTYGKDANEPVISGNPGNGAVTYLYKAKDAADSTYSEDVPAVPGSYTVKATVAETTNYKSGTATAGFTIGNATLTGVSVEQNGTLTYDGNPLTAKVKTNATAVNGQTVTFTYCDTENGTYTTTVPAFTGAGTYTVYYKAAAAYHDTATGSFEVKIGKATVTEPTIESKPYTGQTQTADVPANDLYEVVTNNGGTSKGSYDVVLKLTDSANYKWETTAEATVTLTFTISGAENKWIVEPSINGWTYGKTASTPTYEAKFGTVVVTYKDADGKTVDNPTAAGNYTAVFTVTATDDYTGLTKEVSFEISKADYDMTNAKWDYYAAFQYDGKAHTVTVTGLPSGVTVKAYTGNSASVVGSYTAKVTFTYDEDNYNAPVLADLAWAIENNWNPTEYTTSGSGWQNTDFVITAKDGYKLSTTNTADGTWVDSLTGSTEGENSITFYVKNETTGAISLAKTESYKLDKTAPTGSVSIDDNEWNDLWNTITFGLFFKEAKTVKVEVATDLSGIAKVEYYDSATALSADAVKAITAWNDMGADYAQDVTAEDAKTFIYYIRITDNAGNVTYISTADATYDLTKPAISGITDGSTYYTTQKVTVTDTNLESVTLNNNAVTGEITLEGNKEATYTIVAKDKAGNETSCTVTMKAIASISAPIDAVTESNVNSGNTDAIAEVEAAAAAVDTTNATDAEKAAIKSITDKCDALQEVIADTAAEYERITDAIASYDSDEVTSDDKAALDKLAEDLKALVESGNLTDSEKTALEAPTATLNGMIETVTEVAEEADRIADAVGDYALETVKSDHKDEIEQLVEDIDALLDTDNLTDEERTALEGEKTKCENLLAKIEGTDALVDKLTEDVGAYDEDTVKSTDKAALEQLVEDIEAVIEGNTNITEDEKAELEALVDTVEDLLVKIEEVAQAPVTEDTEKVKDITSENVTSEDKEDLEKAKADLEDALTENAGNCTEDEKKAIQEEIDRIDDALESIEKVEAVEETISELPAADTVKPDDEDAIKAITDAKAEYDALTDHEKSLVSEDTKKKMEDLCAALVAYDIIKGENGKYTQGGSKGLSFTANGAYSKFSGILVDNKVVDPKHYTAESGSTVITLKASYLDTLSTGKHTLTVVYTDGETSCEFNIAAKSTTPATGDNSHMMLWFSLMIVSCAAILVLLNYKRFFSYGGKYSK